MKNLSSWNIQLDQQFYPIGINSIGENMDLAVTTYAAHTVNTFIFRDFSEHIRINRSPYKSFLHKTLFPDRIKEITLGSKESAILLENGKVMYFTSAKKLKNVGYLEGVKSICSARNGFVSICTSTDGKEFFMEFHSDVFQINEAELAQRKKFDIHFEQLSELQNTWHQSKIKIKELCFNAGRNMLHNVILPHDIDVIYEKNDSFLFLSIDKSFCSIHIVNDELFINPIVLCTTGIVDFWIQDDYILMLLESGSLEIIYSHGGESGINKKSLYIGCEGFLAYHFHEGMFIYSNGTNLEYGMIELLNENSFRFQRKSIGLPGIAAITYLPQFELILCVSENCRYYTISTHMDEKKQQDWIQIDENVQKKLSNVRFKLIELSDVYERLVDQHIEQKRIRNVIQMKRYNGDNNDDEKKYRFVAACSVMTQTPPHYYDSSKNTIYVSNSMAYDRTASFFVTIMIFNSVRYANEFDANSWSLCCRWLNDKQENVCANLKLVKGHLSNTKPLKLLIHLHQNHLPSFQLDVFTILDFSNPNNSSLHFFNFPVCVNQPNYCEIVAVDRRAVDLSDDVFLVCTVSIPKSVPISDLLQNMGVDNVSPDNAYTAYLLKKTLTAIHCPEADTLQLFSKDADLMHFFKLKLHQRIEDKLSNQGCLQYMNVKIPNDTLKAYFVSKQSYHNNRFHEVIPFG